MDDLGDLLMPASVQADLSARTKKTILSRLAATLAAEYGLDAEEVGARLVERERLGSTGFGGGVALPHAKIGGLDRVVGAFVRLAEPIDYKAIDEMPVDIVFVLLSPHDAGADHLKALARVSRRLRDPAFVAKLRGAGSRDALYALLAGADQRDAA